MKTVEKKTNASLYKDVNYKLYYIQLKILSSAVPLFKWNPLKEDLVHKPRQLLERLFFYLTFFYVMLI